MLAYAASRDAGMKIGFVPGYTRLAQMARLQLQKCAVILRPASVFSHLWSSREADRALCKNRDRRQFPNGRSVSLLLFVMMCPLILVLTGVSHPYQNRQAGQVSICAHSLASVSKQLIPDYASQFGVYCLSGWVPQARPHWDFTTYEL
ncbi:hypothetical protein TrVGV298_008563 [Trichoderma virens]|nr:hypothetical protein TrVGV298_008563 [Trichoderma virens]